MTTNHAFIHKFKNGNVCTLIFDFNNKVIVKVKWKNPVIWSDIETEYILWRDMVVKEYMDGLSENQRNIVLK